MSNWLAESLRCTVFPSEHDEQLPDFEAAMGFPPDHLEAQPRLGVARESAVLEDGATTVALERFPSLAHFRVGVPPEARMATGVDLPSLQPAHEAFMERAKAWLRALPQLSRIAYGAVLVLPVSSRVDGYEVLDQLLHAVTMDPHGSEDFRFQINRPREIEMAAGSVRVNRLTKWSVRRVQLLAGQLPEAMSSGTVDPEYHVMLDVDVNTAPGVGVLPDDADGVVDVFATLLELGNEIAEKGDVP